MKTLKIKNQIIGKDQIINLLEKSGIKTPQEIMVALGYDDADTLITIMKLLTMLEDEYLLTHDLQGHFGLLSQFNCIIGTIQIKEQGYGFVTPLDEDDNTFSQQAKKVLRKEKDIYIKDPLDAFTQDIVLVKVTKHSAKGCEGTILKVLKRGNQFFCGQLKKNKLSYYLRPTNFKQDIIVIISQKDLNGAKLNQYVKVYLKRFGPNGICYGEVVDIIGNKNDLGIDITMMVLEAGLSTKFNPQVNQEASLFALTINPKEIDNREDYRDQLIFTIDGDDAKDFDDAVGIKQLPNGDYLLGVYIADVSHYVLPATSIDLEATNRLFSVYLPDRVIPMLPEILSNELCSLKPNVDRLVVGCQMQINAVGQMVDYHIFEGVINSKYRLTYRQVNQLFDQIDQCQEPTISDQQLVTDLTLMRKLARILNQSRLNKGALDLDTSEVKVILNPDGQVKDLEIRTRGISENLIEEFMLMANFCIAGGFKWLETPFIYRVHDTPKADRLAQFKGVAESLGYQLSSKNGDLHPKALQKVLNQAKEKDQLSGFILNNLLLRCQAKAKYHELNIGHFGLASDGYTHFTSPIRRYPDLLVHRLIKDQLLKTVPNPLLTDEYIHQIAKISSNQERIIERVERDVIDMKKCEYMERYLDQTFTGIISSVTSRGFYVQLDNTVEGFVNCYEQYQLGSRLFWDEKFTWFDSVNGNRYRIGDYVKVVVDSVSKIKREINFKLEVKNEHKTREKSTTRYRHK